MATVMPKSGTSSKQQADDESVTVDIVGLCGSKDEGDAPVESLELLLSEGVIVPVEVESAVTQDAPPASPFLPHAAEIVAPVVPEEPPKPKLATKSSGRLRSKPQPYSPGTTILRERGRSTRSETVPSQGQEKTVAASQADEEISVHITDDFVDAGAVEDSKEADWKPTKSAGAKKLGRPREPPADAANERPAKRTRKLSKRAGGGEDISGGGPAGEAAVPAAGDRADAHAQAVAEVKDGQGSVGPAAKEPVPQAGGLAGAAEARRGNVARGPSVENKPSKSPYKPMSSLPPAPPKTEKDLSDFGHLNEELQRAEATLKDLHQQKRTAAGHMEELLVRLAGTAVTREDLQTYAWGKLVRRCAVNKDGLCTPDLQRIATELLERWKGEFTEHKDSGHAGSREPPSHAPSAPEVPDRKTPAAPMGKSGAGLQATTPKLKGPDKVGAGQTSARGEAANLGRWDQPCISCGHSMPPISATPPGDAIREKAVTILTRHLCEGSTIPAPVLARALEGAIYERYGLMKNGNGRSDLHYLRRLHDVATWLETGKLPALRTALLHGKLTVAELAAFDVKRAEEINAKLSGQAWTPGGPPASLVPPESTASPARDCAGTNGAALLHSTEDVGGSGGPPQGTATDAAAGPTAMDVDSTGPCGPLEGTAGASGGTPNAEETNTDADMHDAGTHGTHESLLDMNNSEPGSHAKAPDPPSGTALLNPLPSIGNGPVPMVPSNAPGTQEHSLAGTPQPVSTSTGDPNPSTTPPAPGLPGRPSFSFPTSGPADANGVPSPGPLVTGDNPVPPSTLDHAENGQLTDPTCPPPLQQLDADPGACLDRQRGDEDQADVSLNRQHAGESADQAPEGPQGDAGSGGPPPAGDVGTPPRAVNGGGDHSATPREPDPASGPSSGVPPETGADGAGTAGGAETAERDKEDGGGTGCSGPLGVDVSQGAGASDGLTLPEQA